MERKIAVSTLSEVIARHQHDASLTPTRRRDLVSSVVRMSELTGVDPRVTPASMRSLRPLINAVRPAKHGLTPKTWSNLRSNFRAAIVHPAPCQPRRRDPDWTKLRRALPNARMKGGLSRCISFFEAKGIPPAAVSNALFDRFHAHLEADANLANPHHCHRLSCRLWNEAAASVAGWPQTRIILPTSRKPRLSLPLGSYPVSLQEEFARYLDYLRSGSDRFAKGPRQKRMAASTARQRGTEILLALSALVARGRDPASITSLACAVHPDAFQTILRCYVKDDENQTPRPFAHNLAVTLIGLARRWVKLGPEAVQELRELQRCLGPQRTGLTTKNEHLLRTLDDPDIRARLLLLPERLARWAERTPLARDAALMMERAVAIAILLSAPLRIANLAALRLDRHLVRPGGPRSLRQIDIPREEVKNNQHLVHELPLPVTSLVDRYVERFRPVLAPPGNPYLFPVGSRSKNPHELSQQIRRVIAKWVGIDMTAHQFRHFAGLVMQKHSPGSFAMYAQLLGHKHVQTSVNFYARLDTLTAGRQFDAMLEQELNKARSYRGKRL
jgi:integrase